MMLKKKIELRKNHLTIMMFSLVGVTLVVFPSIINSIIENLDGIIIGILIVLGAIFVPFYFMDRKKN